MLVYIPKFKSQKSPIEPSMMRYAYPLDIKKSEIVNISDITFVVKRFSL